MFGSNKRNSFREAREDINFELIISLARMLDISPEQLALQLNNKEATAEFVVSMTKASLETLSNQLKKDKENASQSQPGA